MFGVVVLVRDAVGGCGGIRWCLGFIFVGVCCDLCSCDFVLVCACLIMLLWLFLCGRWVVDCLLSCCLFGVV